jgi:hypothetical protein
VIVGLIAALFFGLHRLGDVQEDAFITFRVARNLADHGHFGFNLDRNYPSATSYAYPLMAAACRLFFGESFVLAILVLNTLAMAATAWNVARINLQLFPDLQPWTGKLWIALVLNPLTILLSLRGMEAVWVVFLLVLAVRKTLETDGRSPAAWFCLFLLPWIRPDALAFAFPLCFWMSFRSSGWNRAVLFRLGFGLAASILLYLGAMHLSYGEFLPAGVLAKWRSGADHLTLAHRLLSAQRVFSHSTLFFPVTTKYLLPFMPWMLVPVSAFALYSFKQNRKAAPAHQRLQFLLWACVLLPPLLYGLGGVVYEWYLWPSRYLFQACFVSACIRWLSRKQGHLPRIAWLGLWLVPAALQILLSINQGAQERFRASVGIELARLAGPQDTLYLEPAGSIPFHAGPHTVDEVGLTDPFVLHYKRLYPEEWWFQALHALQPAWTVQREHLREGRTFYGDILRGDQKDWIGQNYTLVRTFRYADWIEEKAGWRRLLLRLGRHPDYILYRRQPASPQPITSP